MTLRLLSVVALFAASTVCQQSLDLSFASPSLLSASYAGSVQSTPLVAGALADLGGASAAAATLGAAGEVELAWIATEQSVGMTVDLSLQFQSTGVLVGQATAQPIEFLVRVNVPPGQVRFELSRSLAGDIWAAIPPMRIDLDDDGSLEIVETNPDWFVQHTRVAGAGPLVIRCTLGGQLTGPGSLDVGLHLRILPGDTIAVPMVSGCMPSYTVRPRFDGGIVCHYEPSLQELGVAVFGLSPAPVLLGTAGFMPCLLWPSADLLVLVPAGQPLVLPIPAAARPLNLYTQVVLVEQFPTLTTTSGWWVQAL